jgi:hypothetical protein
MRTRPVERRAVRDEHAPLELGRQIGQHRLGGGRLVDHRLADAGEALDPARQRRADLQQRLPAVVQLAAADEHGADLGQLARAARGPVGLRVDDEELGGAQGRVEQHDHEVYAQARTARNRRCADWRAVRPPARVQSHHPVREEVAMTAVAPQRDLDRKRAEAWIAYSESLRDLDGRDYEDAERTSWEELQATLALIDGDRAPPTGG